MRPGPRRRRWTQAIACLAILGAAGIVRAAESPISIETIRVGFPVEGKDTYEVGAWTPVWVDLVGGPRRFAGVVEVVTPDDDGTSTSFTRPVDVGAREAATVQVYTRPGRRFAEFAINLHDEGGRKLVASKTITPEGGTGGALNLGQSLIVTAGLASGIEEVANISGLASNVNGAYTTGGPVVVAPLRMPGGIGSSGIPGRWYGYEAAEVVVLNTNLDDRSWEALNRQGVALERWVHEGGHLVVAVGSRWQTVGDPTASFLAPMLPALPKGRAQLNDLGALESFANSKSPIPVGGRRMQITQLEPVEARGGRGLDATAPTPLVVRGHYGFGRVTVVGLDVDQKPFADWPDRKDFWLRVLDLRRRSDDPGSTTGPQGFFQNSFSDLATLLHAKLEQFPGVTLVPFPYVAFFVFVYILLIGPGDYFFLKKVVKRMELTWITFPTIVATVSLLAYLAAYAVKGTELKINKVDAVDIDQSAKQVQARGTTWFTLFSPQNRDYDPAAAPLPLDEPAGATSAPPKVSSGAEIVMSYFGAAEGPNGMGNPGGLALSARSYSYEPTGEARGLSGVRVPIWTTKSFLGRWSGPSRPVVDADLKAAGPDRLSGSITNRLPRSMRNAYLISGKQILKLGALEPGQVRSIDAIDPVGLAGEVERFRSTFPNYAAPYQASDNHLTGVSPFGLVFATMFHDAAGSGPSSIANVPLRYLDLTGQLALDRPMFVAEVDGPASSLDLGPASGAPKVEQTTVIRAILPVVQ